MRPAGMKTLFLKFLIIIAAALLLLGGGCSRNDYSDEKDPVKRLELLEKSISGIRGLFSRYYDLDMVGYAAIDASELNKAEMYAKELLDTAKRRGHDWNYGNAIHHGNLILGRVALRRRQLEIAKQYLLEAGRTPGSPQLNSYGPNMTLAKELLDKGEKAVVLEYFELCKIFWVRGRGCLDHWSQTVQENRMPNFGSNLYY
jgi:hypothetical protein